METEFPVWLLLALPVAFGLGWLASRLDLRQLRAENRSAPKAYFKGLNYLLNEQQDQAIDAFIEAVQKDPDTSELHFALGNLFRRRGEYERAVRVHQHLLGRADLSSVDRDRAQYALAMDFLKAGLLDHAETALRVLENSPTRRNQAQMALLGIYERSRDWELAGKAAEALEQDGENDFSKRRSHFLCERADAARKQGDLAAAAALLQQALE
ncbi:MAG: tetratricopeptide repeat protein, partial [Brachymonas denitrificans]